MTALMEGTDVYLDEFARFEKQHGAAASWLTSLRRQAIARFTELGFPSTRQEDWRFTNVAPLARTPFKRADGTGPRPSAADIEPYLFGETSRLVFINGRFSPELSTNGKLPDGVRLGSLAATLQQSPARLEPHLARHAKFDEQTFTALNTAFFEDGAFLEVPRGRVVEQPIHLLFISTASAETTVTHPRSLIVLGEGSQVSLIETYAGLGNGVYFTNAVTEIVAGQNAVVDHYRVQRETERAFHIGTLQLYQDRTSNVTSLSVALGGGLTRNDVNTILDGEGAECTLNGLYMLTGTQHVDNHLRVEHAKPHCNSWEYYKGILDQQARGVFTGRIIVHKDAQKTDAKQTNMNLLLSEEAQIDTKPQLEIYADDVKCTHGATIGQIDTSALFYLRARGIPDSTARSMLIYAFANESLSQIRIPPLRSRLEKLLFERLPAGERLGEAV